MSHMNLKKENLTNLDLNPGHKVNLVPDWVGFCMVKDYLLVSPFLLISHAMVIKGHLLSHK